MSTKMQVEWRRGKVLELLSMGNSQTEIAKIIQIDLSIVSRDTSFLRQQAKDNIRKYIDERLPEEYEKCLVGLNAIVKEAWNTSHQAEDKREKIQALSLAKECYGMKLDLLTNATVVDDAIRFVTANTNNKKAISRATCGTDTVSNQRNDVQPFNVMKDNLQEQQRPADNDVSTGTTNQVF
jgi:GMP synthase PP-ATPase subunit